MDMKSITTLAFGGILFVGSFIGLVVLIVKKAKGKNKQEESPTIDKSVLDSLPIRAYQPEAESYIKKDSSIIDIFKIVTKDLNSASESEKSWDNMKFAKLYQTYPNDIKIFALNYPCNTQEQQKYWKEKKEETTNKVIKKLQEQRIYQLEWLEKNNTSREFYLMIFAQNIDDYFKKKSAIFTCLATGREGLIEEIPREKKHQILFKLNNKSAYIF